MWARGYYLVLFKDSVYNAWWNVKPGPRDVALLPLYAIQTVVPERKRAHATADMLFHAGWTGYRRLAVHPDLLDRLRIPQPDRALISAVHPPLSSWVIDLVLSLDEPALYDKWEWDKTDDLSGVFLDTCEDSVAKEPCFRHGRGYFRLVAGWLELYAFWFLVLECPLADSLNLRSLSLLVLNPLWSWKLDPLQTILTEV